MKIGLLLPSLLMAKRFEDRIFAPKDLFLSLANGLVEKGHEVFAYSTSNTQTKAHLIKGNQTLENRNFISIRDVRKNPEAQAALTFERNLHEYEFELSSRAFAHANENKLDILHVYLDNFSHYFAEFSNVPVIFTLHDPVFDEDILENFRLKLFSHHNYITISDYQKQTYQRLLRMSSLNTILHGLDITNFDFSENSEDHMALLGRYLPEKGFDTAIKIANQTHRKLKLASSKNYQKIKYYEDEIKPLLNSPYIEEEEFFPNIKDKANFLGRAKLFLFPIKWEEPFGMVMIEAMATGTPVVAYARGSVPEVVKDGQTGFIVNSSENAIRGDFIIKKTGIGGLEEAVQRIYSMPGDEYRNMRKACRKLVEKNFTVQRMVEDYERLYKKLIRK